LPNETEILANFEEIFSGIFQGGDFLY